MLLFSINRGANLSPFGEIRRFHLEIGHSRELCRSVKKKMGGGGLSYLRVICVTSPLAFFPSVGRGMDPPYSASDWLNSMFFPSSNQSHSWSLTFRRCRQLSIFRTECICICCKLWCSSLNGDYRVRLLFFFCLFVLPEAAVAIATKIVSYFIVTLARYPLQNCASVSTLTCICLTYQ